MYHRPYRARNTRYSHRNSFRGNVIHESKFIKKATTTDEGHAFVPTLNFQTLPISDTLKKNIIKRGFATPTPIQDGVIPLILEGKDVIGIANTGTGKTAAFLIPLIEKILKNDRETVLIITPTRELALQIQNELRQLTSGMKIFSSLCIGGSSIRTQIYELRRNPHVIIGTPGRLKDLIERNVLRLSLCNSIVLDEVDRMLDMGFIHDIKYLLSLLPQKRHSLFFSATISAQVGSIIHTFLQNPVTVSVKSHDTADNIDQNIVRVGNGKYKIDILEDLLKKSDFQKVLIFGRTKRGVEKLSSSLYDKGFKVAAIHGDKPQAKRHQAIRFFREDVVNILVATDVAARGIDIPNISHVINYDQPATYEDYIHRIGRTGRANRKGYALTFV